MKIGICAIIKDCYEPYLLEWLNHHHSIGVDYFFIYDNESEIPIYDIIKDMNFRESIFVTTIEGKVKQFSAYHKCLDDIEKGVLPHCDRVAFIDDDEFIVCENNDIKEILKEYANFSGLGISWRIFGSSGIKEKNPVPQKEKFTSYTKTDYPPNKHIKSIVNPLLTIGTAGNPHSFSYSSGYCVNVDKEVIENAFSTPIYRKIWIDHYYTRSLEEWKEKMIKGRSDLDAKRSLSEFYEVDFNCSERISKQIHLVTPFYRHHLKDKLIEAYRPMDIIWHPIVFQDEVTDFNESWIFPTIIPMDSKDCKVIPGNFKRNWFIKNSEIIDDDYYVAVDDDDMYEMGVFNKIKQMSDDIVIISMKRGYQIPMDIEIFRQYSATTLIARPENVKIATISGQQSFIKGKIFKQHLFNEESYVWDGEMAIHHKESGEQIAYRPDLFALFNYYELGRWDPWIHKIAFGCMVNDLNRLNMILRNSEIENVPCYTVMNPDSAAKGLNKLLDIIESKGVEIGILTHQDMYYRRHWINQLKNQLALLPENWVIAGIVGKDEKGNLCGRFHDMSTPLCVASNHDFPVQCSCLDECTIIVNMKSGFRFDEVMEGFDLYGTYACLRAKEMGMAFILDAWAEHYCWRFHDIGWEPDELFKKSWQFLKTRFPGQQLYSTVLVDRERAEK